MASIVNRRLDILTDEARNTSKCTVTCTVNFTEFEVASQRNGLQYQMKCQLFGDDSGLTFGDDLLHTYAAQTVPNGSVPSASVNLKFEATLPTSTLNEDRGGDEILGRLTLINPAIEPRKVQKDTNVIGGQF